MSNERILLGIDAGTSVAKAALFTKDGNELASIAKRTTLLSPQLGWSEVSMIETWDQVTLCISELLSSSGVLSEQIEAIGVTGNMVGAWLIDHDGAPVRNAILWNDARAQPWIEQKLEERPTFMSEIFASSGSVMQQGCTLPVLRWLAEYEPANLEQTQAVLCCKDWIVYCLTGTIQLDPTQVAGMPGSAKSRSYSDAMFELLEVADYRHLFPCVVPSTTIVGEVLESVAERTGLKAGTPVIAGVGDVPAVTVGIGAVEPGTAATILGTNILNGVVYDEPIFEPKDLGLLFCIPGERWMRTMVNVAGTTNLDWFIDQFCKDLQHTSELPGHLFAMLEKLAVESGIGAQGIVYLPYLSTQGIITPFFEPKARAEFFGVHNEHERGDFIRAVYEGVAYSICDSYEVIPCQVNEMRLSGGGAKSPFWSQMIADCTGMRVLVASGNEFGAKGVALLAGLAIGWYASLPEAIETAVKIAHVYEPDPLAQERYNAIYRKYRRLQKQLLPLWQ